VELEARTLEVTTTVLVAVTEETRELEETAEAAEGAWI